MIDSNAHTAYKSDMARLPITHKNQTRLNDCWYACIQMLRTYKNNGLKTKPQGVTLHRDKKLFAPVWGNPLGADDPEYRNILEANDLRDVSASVGVGSLKLLQEAVDTYGPLIVGGGFGKLLRVPGTNRWLVRGLGHYVVVAGTDTVADTVLINDPDKRQEGSVPFASFKAEAWRGDQRTIIANNP